LKRCLLAFLTLLIGLAPTAGYPADTKPFEIPVVLSLTSQGAFLGKAEKQSIDLIEGIVNRSGGINGQPVKFVIYDDQTNPQIAVQIANGLIAKKVPIILGSSFTAPCEAMIPLVQKGPVLYCFAPTIHPKRGGYIFSASVSTQDDILALIRYFRLSGKTRLGVITATDAGGQQQDRAIEFALSLPENKNVTITDHEHFAPNDLSVSAQIARIQATNPQAVIAWTTGAPFGTLLRSINDIGLDVPVATSTGDMIYAQLAQYTKFLPKELYFPGLRSMSPEGTSKGPVFDAQRRYFEAFAKIGVRPDFANNEVWDTVLIVIDAFRHIGTTATAEQLRDYIGNLHGWVGINGVYDFSDPEQRGISEGSIVIDRWDRAKNDFVPISKPGGIPK
jgi:branched-chain amino acid transport system substrate-binding protein